MDIVWADGHRSHYDFAFLRELCPCAMCNDERRKETGHGGAALEPFARLGAADVQAETRARARPRPVGNYALQIDFTDGHDTGIYSYEYLRTICPCEECAKHSRTKVRIAAVETALCGGR